MPLKSPDSAVMSVDIMENTFPMSVDRSPFAVAAEVLAPARSSSW